MRIANIAGWPMSVTPDGLFPLSTTERSPLETVLDLLEDPENHPNASTLTAEPTDVSNDELMAPVWGARNIIGLGYNYRSHVVETGADQDPLAFFRSHASIGAPFGDVTLQGDTWDYEVELVVVIGREARCVPDHRAWDYIGGFLIGQDITDRDLQRNGQLCMSKSRPGTAPVGPYLVTKDEVDPSLDGLRISCSIDSDLVQDAPLTDMVWSPREIVSRISHWTDLWPGDLIFTGTPDGVGLHRQPQLFLRPGHVIQSTIDTLGTFVNKCVESSLV